ncbi:MauE/DoxX family redox-associated membrane protein [Angustibacter sp. McL0619]|uniref:MauE/DoxX family redox-associated membrane protein n=1 Tax=Angustibacter sp. McL0619 TaxID=3415676 RepID=UPI003CF9E3B8
MGSAAICPFLAAAGLLVLAGLPKLKDPLPLVRALRSVELTAPIARRPVVRLLAAGEVLLGVAAVVRPGRVTGVLVAVGYLAFSAFVLLVLRRGGVLASCGCFGRPDTPATPAHLLTTLLLAASGLLVAASPPDPAPWTVLTDQPVLALVGAAFAVLVAALSYLVIAVLPTLTPAAVRSASAPQRG